MIYEVQLNILCVDSMVESIQGVDCDRVLEFLKARDHEGSSLTLNVRDTPDSPLRSLDEPERIYALLENAPHYPC